MELFQKVGAEASGPTMTRYVQQTKGTVNDESAVRAPPRETAGYFGETKRRRIMT